MSNEVCSLCFANDCDFQQVFRPNFMGMNDATKKGTIDFAGTLQRFPEPGQPAIDMSGFNAIQFKGQVENAIISIHFEGKQSITKDIVPIGITNKVNDTFPFPLGDNKGMVEFSFQKIDPTKPSHCQIHFELINLSDDEFTSLSGRVFQMEIPPNAPLPE